MWKDNWTTREENGWESGREVFAPEKRLRTGEGWDRVYTSRQNGFSRRVGADILTICLRKSVVPTESGQFRNGQSVARRAYALLSACFRFGQSRAS